MKFTIKTKLAIAFSALVVTMAGGISLGIYQLSLADATQTEVITGPARKLSIAQSIQFDLAEMLNAEVLISTTDDNTLIAEYNRNFEARRKDLEREVETGISLASAAGKPSWIGIKDKWAELRPSFDHARQLGIANRNEEAAAIINGSQKMGVDEINRLAERLVDLSHQQMQEAQDTSAANYTMSRNLLIAVLVAAIALGIGAAVWISLTISRGLKVAQGAVRAVAEGDLNHEAQVTSHDEIRDLVDTVNDMSRTLRGIIGELFSELRKLTGPKGYAFPALYTSSRPMSENTLNVAFRRMGFGKDEVTSHGLRATASTLLNESGLWNPDAIERALAHGISGGGVRGSYHRGEHWPERVLMAQWWSDYLDKLRIGGEVLPFSGPSRKLPNWEDVIQGPEACFHRSVDVPGIQLADFAAFVITRTQWAAVKRTPSPTIKPAEQVIFRAAAGLNVLNLPMVGVTPDQLGRVSYEERMAADREAKGLPRRPDKPRR